jgi:Brp/Blh family beta-carotene 15,15'-monooxygenase
MNKLLFIYIIFCYLIASIFTLYNTISLENQLIGCFFLIILFGIPHGAIDNVLSLSGSNLSKKKFYFLYLLSMILYAIIWFIIPVFSFVFFLLISSYHFGESQLSNYNFSNIFSKIIYLVWGIALMSTLFFYNSNELTILFNSFNDTSSFNLIFKYHLLDILFYFSNASFILILIYLKIQNSINSQIFSSEIYQIALLHITFFVFPVIISFTLYFVFLHSIKVLIQEYSYLEQKFNQFNLIKFVQLLIPFTLLSLIFF